MRARQAELLSVPERLALEAWYDASYWLSRVPELDLNAARIRVLKGEDRLWLPILTAGRWPAQVPKRHAPCLGVVITRVTEASPMTGQSLRSLIVHLAEGVLIQLWLPSAVQKLTHYAKDQDCSQLFILARRGWRTYATHFYSREFLRVGYSRDRPTPGKGSHYPGWNAIGNFRTMEPVEGMTKQDYNSGTMCRFEERDAAV